MGGQVEDGEESSSWFLDPDNPNERPLAVKLGRVSTGLKRQKVLIALKTSNLLWAVNWDHMVL